MNQAQSQEKIFEDHSFKVRVGPSLEIPSVRALRPKSLDSLVVFWDSKSYQGQLYDILRSKQRLIFVLVRWQDVKNFLLILEATLLDYYGENPLSQSSDKLLLKLTYAADQFVLEF